MDIEKLTSIGQLRGEQRELAETIGLDAYKSLIVRYAGSFVYVCKPDTILKEIRDSEIRERFDGGNYRSLALAYNLAEATVRDIVADKSRQLRKSPMEGQMQFKDI